ncbi:MAG: outer membrane beta-barrel domain-containing protein [Deltaproteobacteria bacterium]|nr:outer membrane beta-barrel domain-containing protein [Deltaproteobacteria bacterium]
MRAIGVWLAMALPISWTGPAAAQQGDESAEARVVQKRRHVPGHEFFVAAGWLPLDAFEKGLTAAGGYALHFDEAIALELSFTQSFAYDTALREELLAEDVEPTPYEIVEQFVAGAFTWTPLYGKLAVGSSGLVHMDLSFSAGGGYGWFTASSRPLALWGSTLRFYLSRLLSARLDVRALHFVQADSLFAGWDLHTEVSMSLGLALSLGG